MNVHLNETLVLNIAKDFFSIGRIDIHRIVKYFPIEIFEAVLVKQHLVRIGIINQEGYLLINDYVAMLCMISNKGEAEVDINLDYGYYLELQNFITKYKSLISNLLNDDTLVIHFDSLRYLKDRILKDLIYITKIINDLNRHTNLVELGYCFVVNAFSLDDIYPNYSSLAMNDLQELLTHGKVQMDYKKSVGSNNEVYQIKIEYEGEIVLPCLLGKTNHNCFEDYSIMLIKYSNLLAYADDYLSIPEDILLKDLHRNINEL